MLKLIRWLPFIITMLVTHSGIFYCRFSINQLDHFARDMRLRRLMSGLVSNDIESAARV